MTPRRLTAFHEAGHVVVGEAIGMHPQVSRIHVCDCGVGDEHWVGETGYSDEEYMHLPDDGPGGLARYIVLCAAGQAAEDRANGAPVDGSGGAQDEVEASKAALVLAYATCLRTARAVMEAAPDHAREALDAPGAWAAVEAVADALDAAGELPHRTAVEVALRPHAAGVEAAGRVLHAATEYPLLGR